MEDHKLEWWGYLHTKGTLHAKRYFGPLDIDEAHESPFVQRVAGPFLATGRDDALRQIAEGVGVIYNPEIHT